jgi:hypothetical protein
MPVRLEGDTKEMKPICTAGDSRATLATGVHSLIGTRGGPGRAPTQILTERSVLFVRTISRVELTRVSRAVEVGGYYFVPLLYEATGRPAPYSN